jgi:hypothetical protein
MVQWQYLHVHDRVPVADIEGRRFFKPQSDPFFARNLLTKVSKLQDLRPKMAEMFC